jgi:hypothetical protein
MVPGGGVCDSLFKQEGIRADAGLRPPADLIQKILLALKKSYENNLGTRVLRYDSTIALLRDHLNEIRAFDLSGLEAGQRLKIAEAFNDLAVGLGEKGRRERLQGLELAEYAFYLYSLRTLPTLLVFTNLARHLHEKKRFQDASELACEGLLLWGENSATAELQGLRKKT